MDRGPPEGIALRFSSRGGHGSSHLVGLLFNFSVQASRWKRAMRSGVAGEGIWQHLQGDVAFQLGVFGTIHLAHAARADGRKDLVGTQATPRREWHKGVETILLLAPPLESSRAPFGAPDPVKRTTLRRSCQARSATPIDESPTSQAVAYRAAQTVRRQVRSIQVRSINDMPHSQQWARQLANTTTNRVVIGFMRMPYGRPWPPCALNASPFSTRLFFGRAATERIVLRMRHWSSRNRSRWTDSRSRCWR